MCHKSPLKGVGGIIIFLACVVFFDEAKGSAENRFLLPPPILTDTIPIRGSIFICAKC